MYTIRTLIIIFAAMFFLSSMDYIAQAQDRNPSKDPNIPTNPNDPTFPRDPVKGPQILVPPPGKEIVIPEPDRNPNDPTFPDSSPPNVPGGPNDPGRIPDTPPQPKPQPIPPRDPVPVPVNPVPKPDPAPVPVDPIPEPKPLPNPVSEPQIPTQPEAPEPKPEIPIDPIVEPEDPNIPRPDDPIPSIPDLPQDPALIQPDMETEFLTAPVFKDETPEILVDLENYVPNQVLVLLNGTSGNEQNIDSLSQDFNVNTVNSSLLSSINATMVLFAIPDSRGVLDVSRILAADARTLVAQPNFYFEGLAEESAQYGVSKIKADSAHSISTGKGIKVAVIDTGIDYSHKALENNVVLRSDFVDVESNVFDVHGTSIAGIIASASIEDGITGVAPDVNIIAARACWSDPKDNIRTICSSDTLAKAIDYAILNRAHIINLSLGGPRDSIITKLIKKADRSGIVIVAAAGNGGPEGKPVYPAALSEVIAVSATDSDDNLYQYSTRGAYIDLSAPGVDILSPAPGNSYQIVSGTSMAAAHVTGAIALVLQEHPELSPFQIKSILGSTSIDLGKKGKDNEFGEGRIDALSALDELNSNP